MNLRLQLIIDYYIGGFLHCVLKPFVVLAGKMLRRDHDLKQCKSVTVIKMLGGGSLTIAYPALVAIKQAPEVQQLRLLTTPGVKPFAEALGVFDEIVVIRIDSPLRLFTDSLAALRKLFRCDAIVDLEIHSRLTTVLALATCARNRVGFYTQGSYWRRYLSTHLLFYNITSGTYYFYDQIAGLFGGEVLPFAHYQESFRRVLGAPPEQIAEPGRLKIAIAPCASDLRKERMLKLEEWVVILGRRIQRAAIGQKVTVELFGAPSDGAQLDAMSVAMMETFPDVEVTNWAGKTVLVESIRKIAQMDELICIDSSLMHYGRLMAIPTTSFWGPTLPESLLRPWPGGREEIHYFKLPCSPCVHLTNVAPCRGNNICMRLAVNPELKLDINPAWIVAEDLSTRFKRPSGP
jgi:ADP-heptose:LPS heptosyltransferase